MNEDLGTLLRDFRNACDAACCAIDDIQRSYDGLAECDDDEAADLGLEPMKFIDIAEIQELRSDLRRAVHAADNAYAAWDNAPQP